LSVNPGPEFIVSLYKASLNEASHPRGADDGGGRPRDSFQQFEIAADHGHYLRPWAKILLALAAPRRKKTEVARTQLREFVAKSPKTRFLRVNWPSSRFLLPGLFPLHDEFFLIIMCFSSLCIWCWYLKRHATARSKSLRDPICLSDSGILNSSDQRTVPFCTVQSGQDC
jgi:hypothetical protein